jgi:hypothetical protein
MLPSSSFSLTPVKKRSGFQIPDVLGPNHCGRHLIIPLSQSGSLPAKM